MISLAVISMIVMVYCVAWVAFQYVGSRHHHYYYNDPMEMQVAGNFWDPKLFAGVVLGTLVVIICGSTYKTMALAGDGGAVAESLGGRLVASNTTDPDERRIRRTEAGLGHEI